MDTEKDFDITAWFKDLLDHFESVDIANSELKKMTAEDPGLHHAYREWCHQVGSTEKNGFLDYCHEYLERREDMWDYLGTDYD